MGSAGQGHGRITVIEPARRWELPNFREFWFYRGLLLVLAVRDIQVRYKQTVIGIAWAVLQPVITMVVFTVIFGRMAKFPSDGLPYPIFAYAALLPWQFFAKALTQGSTSLVSLGSMMSKIYFPRIIAPLASILSGAVDFAIAFVILLGLMAWYGVYPGWAIVTLPLFLIMAVVTSLGVSLWLSGLNVRYRDVQFALPFLAQIWMFLTPVVYPVSMVPEEWRLIYMVNPMAGVIEGFRWALLGTETAPDPLALSISGGVMVLLMVGGLIYFSTTEKNFADRL